LKDIRYAFAQGNAAPLVKAAKAYVASQGAGVSPALAEKLLHPDNQVNGGLVYRDNRTGKIMVSFDGAAAPMTLSAAIAGGHIKVTEDAGE